MLATSLPRNIFLTLRHWFNMIRSLFLSLLLTFAFHMPATSNEACTNIDENLTFCPQGDWSFLAFDTFDQRTQDIIANRWNNIDHLGLAISIEASSDEFHLSGDILDLSSVSEMTNHELFDLLLQSSLQPNLEFEILDTRLEIEESHSLSTLMVENVRQRQTPDFPDWNLQPINSVMFNTIIQTHGRRYLVQNTFANLIVDHFRLRWEEGKALDDYRLDTNHLKQIHLDVVSMIKWAEG